MKKEKDERETKVEEYSALLAVLLDNPKLLEDAGLKVFLEHHRVLVEKLAAEKQQQLVMV